MGYARRISFARETLVVAVTLAALFALARAVPFQPLQIPGYLLTVGFDVIERAFESVGAPYPIALAAYFVALGAVGAAVARGARARTADGRDAGLRLGAIGVLAVLGAISVSFAVAISVGTSQLAPALATGVSGLLLLGLAGWVAELFAIELR